MSGEGDGECLIKEVVALDTERLQLSIPDAGKASAALDYYRRNREHLAPWDPPPPDGFFSLNYWEDRLTRGLAEFYEGRSARFFVSLRQEPQRIVGSVNLTNIVRGAFHAANVGYSFDGELQGRGYMTEALKEVVRFGFMRLGLHRLMAAYIPHNEGSGRVLQKVGFEREGYAKEYLYIAGAWQDHILTAMTNTDFAFPKDE